MKVEKSFIWRLSPSPDDPHLMLATLGSGAARLVSFKAPGHRVMIGMGEFSFKCPRGGWKD